MTGSAAPAVSPAGVRALGVTAAIAWLGVVLTLVLSFLGGYDSVPVDPGMYGDTPAGMAGAANRLADSLSYFTIWSNIVVAISLTLTARQPEVSTLARRVLRTAGLLMITITLIVYQAVLAPTIDVTGWSLLTDPILHLVTPLLAIVTWLFWGPRGWVRFGEIPLALVIPVVWLGWVLGRGAVIDSYPYGFINVVDLGYPVALRNIAVILVFGLLITALFYWLDTRAARRKADSDTMGI